MSISRILFPALREQELGKLRKYGELEIARERAKAIKSEELFDLLWQNSRAGSYPHPSPNEVLQIVITAVYLREDE